MRLGKGLLTVLALAVCAAAWGDTAVPYACETILDTTPPVIALTGAAAINIAAGSTYQDPGATAMDNIDGDVTARIAVAGSVNTAVAGAYTVTYNVSDATGNAAAQVTRTVNVTGSADITKPVITLVGSPNVTVEVLSVYTDAGATAADPDDGDVTARIVTVSTVDTAKLGAYTVTYNVSDPAGNAADPVVRAVKVVDTTPPVITINEPGK